MLRISWKPQSSLGSDKNKGDNLSARGAWKAYRTFLAMTVFPSAAPRWRNFTSSLLPSLNICCTWRKFTIWNQLNMQSPGQDHPMPTGVVKWGEDNMVTWGSATLWHNNLSCTEDREQKKLVSLPYRRTASSKGTRSISIVKILAINITAHTDTPLTFNYKNIVHVFSHVCASGAWGRAFYMFSPKNANT
jgi:hypothetical protein